MSKTIKETYLFLFNEDFFIAKNVSKFKEAFIQFSKYTGTSDEIFLKALNGMETNEEMIKLYNHFSVCYTIEHVYKIDSVVYSDTGETEGGD